MKLLYFDWNVFTNVKNPKTEHFVSVAKIIEEIKNIYHLPYSSSHLDDLKKGYKDEEPYIGYTNRDLNYLLGVCKDVFWFYDYKSESILGRKGNPINVFEPYKETQPSVTDCLNLDEIFSDMEEFDLSQHDLSHINLVALGLTGKETVNMGEFLKNSMKALLDNPIANPLKDIPDASPLKKPLANMLHLKGETNTMNQIVQGMAKYVDENQVDPTAYKDLRTGFKDTLNIPFDISNWKDNTWDRLDEFCILNMKKSFTDLVVNSIKEQKKEPNLHNMFITAYSFLDLFNFRSENLSKKNTAANISNDAFHGLMAGYCDIYVTDDKNSRAKVKVLYDKFNLKTEILTSQEFLEKFQA